jgi:hypothetical protein
MLPEALKHHALTTLELIRRLILIFRAKVITIELYSSHYNNALASSPLNSMAQMSLSPLGFVARCPQAIY